jgi:antitoxin component of RelBE/YafQ-DinJ toxin-antitoxin module
MEHIKTTPPELGVPSFDIELADRLCEEAGNPGIKTSTMFKLAKRVAKRNELSFDQKIKLLEDMAIEALKESKRETDRIERTTQEATHKIIDGAHLFQGYEPADKPDYFPGA